MTIDLMLRREEELMIESINLKFALYDDILSSYSKETIDGINQNLSNMEDGISYDVHRSYTLDLIYTYLTLSNINHPENIVNHYFECGGVTEFNFLSNLDASQIPNLCDELHTAFLNSKFEVKNGKFIRTKSKDNLIESGAVYTKNRITSEIVKTTINNFTQSHENLSNINLLDFACGTGRFYEEIVKILFSSYNIPASRSILEHIYAIDIDPVAINITRLKAINFLDAPTEDDIKCVSTNIICRNVLIEDNIFYNFKNGLNTSDCRGLVNGKFDIVVSNPPYLVLKANKNKGSDKFSSKIQEQVNYFRNSNQYHYSIEGMLNYYQLSIEKILTMTKKNGEIGIICPSSLFADVSATKLRSHLLLQNKLRKIRYFAEKEPLFDNVSQATNIFYLQKSGNTDVIEIETNDKVFPIDFSSVKELFPENLEIPFISEVEWSALSKISKFNKLKSFSNIRNRRGELDLTLFKKYITNQETPYRLVRGNMIGDNEIKNINYEYVTENFLGVKSSDYLDNDFNRKRLICQQISNGGQKRRLKFVFCSESDILGNSCNYISADPKILEKLYILLNSRILNWRFKITSSNNHINNYELNELPIVDLNLVDLDYINNKKDKIDEYICNLYGLNLTETSYIING